MIEASVYQPQQELVSKSLSQGVDINGSHDILPIQETPQKSAPFAFDLGREFELTQKFGNSYKKHFLENAHYYAKESYGRVPVSEYEHKILENEDGSICLALGPDNQSARECYLTPAQDTSRPEWYRRRSMGDVRWVDAIEKALVDSSEGDTFIDLSPTEFNVTVKERKAWGYGYHSFARIHKIVVENGQKKLVSRAVRNYLDAPEQEELFEKLAGERVDVDSMLGVVAKVDNGTSQGYIKSLSEELYKKTPDGRKIIPPEEYIKNIKSEQEMDCELQKVDAWLTVVFEMMQRGESPAKIVSQFRGWENAVKDYVEGKCDLKQFENITLDGMREAVVSGNSLVTSFVNRQYSPGANGCGLGSGFGVERNDGTMSYESMTKTTEGDCPEIKCGNKEKRCNWIASESEVDEITSGRLTKCPKCGWKP